MNKKLLFAATVATMLASCSSDDLSVQTAKQQDAASLENAVSFEALSQRGLTRAGEAGAMDNAKLQEEGFGVFGYYTDLNEYDQTSTPNFMYNQEVKYSGGSWTYEPIKYWPNEYGNKAQSDDVDKVTFFAYAPYTVNTPATGKVTEDQVGITGFTRNSAAGDPYVKYVGSLDPLKCVDLCWGVCADADKTWGIIQGGNQTMEADFPWLNVQRPQKSLGQKMKFTFKHALSQLNVQIDADVNTDQHGEGDELDGNTKVFVRSITFNGFAMKGALNLNNEEAGVPNWKGYNCNNEPILTEEYTIYDGMKDGKEGTGYTASNEKVTGLNPTIIQSKKWADQAAADGVQKTAKNLFNNTDATAPIYVIPTGDDMSVTIVYDIETADEKLLSGTVSDNETNGVSIGNRISKTITVTRGTDALKLEAGKKYTINLHLGMSQVEFDATVEDWDEAAAAAGEAWLPENGAPGPNSISISGADGINAASNYAGQLTATVTPAEADQSVTWSSSNPDVLAVDANGNVSLVSLNGIDINGKDVEITATSNADNSFKDTKIINVKPALGMIVASNGKVYTVDGYDSSYGEKVAVVAMPGYAIALQNSDSQTWNEITDNGTNKDIDLDLPESKRGSVPAAPAGTTWKILTFNDYSLVFAAMGSTGGSFGGTSYDSNVNTYITAAGGDALSGPYWSSELCGGGTGAGYGWTFSDSRWYAGSNMPNSSSLNVRSVLVW